MNYLNIDKGVSKAASGIWPICTQKRRRKKLKIPMVNNF